MPLTKAQQRTLDQLNDNLVVDTRNIKEFHASTKVRNHHEGLFRTADGKRYVVDPHGTIRRTEKVKIEDAKE